MQQRRSKPSKDLVSRWASELGQSSLERARGSQSESKKAGMSESDSGRVSQREQEWARVSQSEPERAWLTSTLLTDWLTKNLIYALWAKKREPTLQFIVSKPVLSLATEIYQIALIFCQKITKPLNWFCFLWIFTQPLQLAGDRRRLNMMALSKRHKKMQNSHWLYVILYWILAQ